MSFSALRRRNRGCYTSPHSGVGVEFAPLGLPPEETGFRLHEAGYLARNDWWEFPNTLSPFWRLYYNFDRGHQVIFGEVPYPLGPDRVVLIPDYQLFHSVGRAPVRHLWLTFSVARRLAPGQALPLLLRPGRVELGLIRELAGLFTGIAKGDRERIHHASLALLHLVLSRPEIGWQTNVASPGLRRALHQMETGFAQHLHVTDLAATAGLSVRAFTKAFTRQQGLGPARFLTRVRAREAASLLANSAHTIEEVAELTGFPNRHYFSRVFKRVVGDSPAHYRRHHGVEQAS